MMAASCKRQQDRHPTKAVLQQVVGDFTEEPSQEAHRKEKTLTLFKKL